MAVFKCKMCGAPLDIDQTTVTTCDYCGSTQTLPTISDDRIERLYDRANTFRQSNEFDRAMSIYEEILNEKPDDAESYWSIVLCKYGVEYVEDPQSHKRIPTVNRAQYTSIFDDVNYKAAVEHADVFQKKIYEEEAEAINEIQKGILDISSKEEPFDVFICYKETDELGNRTHDSVYANELYHELRQEGFKVFYSRITLEDKLGTAYEPYIFAALNSAKVMVVIGTKPEYFSAVWVKNEWSRYLNLIKNGEKKVLIPAYKDMDAYDLPREFAHLQAQDMTKLGFMPDLIRGIKKIIGKKPTQQPQATTTTTTQANNSKVVTGVNVDALLKRAALFLEAEQFKDADIYCEKVLDVDAENVKAYIYKLLVQIGGTSEEHLAYSERPLDTYASYKNALRFADEETANRLIGYNTTVKERIAAERAAEDERKRQENIVARERAQKLNDLNYLSTERAKAQRRLTALNREAIHLDKVIRKERRLVFTKGEMAKAIAALAYSSIMMFVSFIALIVCIILSATGGGALVAVPVLFVGYFFLSLTAIPCFNAYKWPTGFAWLCGISLMIPAVAFGIVAATAVGKASQKKHMARLAAATQRRDKIPAEMSEARNQVNSFSNMISQRQRGILAEVPKEYVPRSDY